MRASLRYDPHFASPRPTVPRSAGAGHRLATHCRYGVPLSARGRLTGAACGTVPSARAWPKLNAEWWRAKIEANNHCDSDTGGRLEAAGWKVIRVWEREDLHAAAGGSHWPCGPR